MYPIVTGGYSPIRGLKKKPQFGLDVTFVSIITGH